MKVVMRNECPGCYSIEVGLIWFHWHTRGYRTGLNGEMSGGWFPFRPRTLWVGRHKIKLGFSS